MIPGAANGTAACGVPGSGLGDTKRAVSFLQPFGGRESCPRSAGDDELYRHRPQQGDAEATAAVCPRDALDGHYLHVVAAVIWCRYTAIFGFVGAIAV